MKRASASGAVDSGLIPCRVKPMNLKLACTASLFDTHYSSRQIYLLYREERQTAKFSNF